jgi:hypothetical protein
MERKMTEAETLELTKLEKLELIRLVKKGKIPKEIFNKTMAHCDEDSKTFEMILNWAKLERLRAHTLFAMGFEKDDYWHNSENVIVFKKDIMDFSGIDFSGNDVNITQLVIFFAFMLGEEAFAFRDTVLAEFSNNKAVKIVDIVQNPEYYPDLIEYIKIRDDNKAMKKLIGQEKE